MNIQVDKGIKKETMVYPNGTRRESTTYPNGVRKDNLIYPNGEKTETIVYVNRNGVSTPNLTSFQDGRHVPNPGGDSRRSSDGRRLSNPASQSSLTNMQIAAHKKTSRGSKPRLSVANIVAPPIKNLQITDEDTQIPKCCFCSNVRIGVILIGLIELLGLAFALYETCHWYRETANDKATFTVQRIGSGMRYAPVISRDGLLAGSIISILLFVIAIFVMFVGVWKKKTNYIVPHLVIQAFAILGAIVGLVITSIAVSILRTKTDNPDDDDNDKNNLSNRNSNDTYNFCVAILVFCILTFILELYFFKIVRDCARFYNTEIFVVTEKELESHSSDHGGRSTGWHGSNSEGHHNR